ncbi:MAG TPA: hypothetical protein VKX49_15300 [Bryobacteraceae bacterium]|nr:hypothetical protein [Bryobacteraceae bacterium]
MNVVQLAAVDAVQEHPACVVTLEEKLPPAAGALTVRGATLNVQFGWTVTLNATACDNPAPVAEIDRLYVPGTAVAAELIFTLTAPEPGALSDVGVNCAVMPAGRPETESATAELKPPLTETFSVSAAPPPEVKETDVGLAASVNEGVGVFASAQ